MVHSIHTAEVFERLLNGVWCPYDAACSQEIQAAIDASGTGSGRVKLPSAPVEILFGDQAASACADGTSNMVQINRVTKTTDLVQKRKMMGAWLSKKAERLGAAKKRWFVIDSTARTVSYYDKTAIHCTPTSIVNLSAEPYGTIMLADIVALEYQSSARTENITTFGGRTYKMKSEDGAEALQWHRFLVEHLPQSSSGMFKWTRPMPLSAEDENLALLAEAAARVDTSRPSSALLYVAASSSHGGGGAASKTAGTAATTAGGGGCGAELSSVSPILPPSPFMRVPSGVFDPVVAAKAAARAAARELAAAAATGTGSAAAAAAIDADGDGDYDPRTTSTPPPRPATGAASPSSSDACDVRVMVASMNVGNAALNPAELAGWLKYAKAKLRSKRDKLKKKLGSKADGLVQVLQVKEDKVTKLIAAHLNQCAPGPDGGGAGSGGAGAADAGGPGALGTVDAACDGTALSSAGSAVGTAAHATEAAAAGGGGGGGRRNLYKLSSRQTRGEMQLLVFTRSVPTYPVHSVESAAENTGFNTKFGHLPNKGGLVTKLTVGTTDLCFIGCHLAAHEGGKYLAARNASVEEILSGARVGDTTIDPAVQFHHCFVFGDLNYRSDVEV
eukprot:gene12135-8459_t